MKVWTVLINSGQSPKMGLCEDSNELSGCIKARYFLSSHIIINCSKTTLHDTVTHFKRQGEDNTNFS
jgi:hypothetical protein